METAADRLRRARIEAGFETGADAIERFGWTKGTYPHNENGNAPFSRKKADAYAKAYGVRADWLYSGTPPVRDGEARTVPLVGYVGAGAQAHFYSDADEGLGEVEAPEGANEHTRAAEIRGTSLGPLFERWLIFYDDVHDPVTADQIGRLCIVGLKDGRVLVKKIKRARADGFYHLESNVEETLYDQEVLWAARVRQMTPR